MRYFVILTILITNFGRILTLHDNLTLPNVGFNFLSTANNNDDDEESSMELSSQLEEIDEITSGWSSWSKWSSCSRSCDGGISHQLRTCKNGLCRGNHVRYKICNMQPCPDQRPDFREEQCSAFNDILYENSFYDWAPFYGDDDDPCSLVCKGKLKNSQKDSSLLIVAILKDKVYDGTRCRPGSLDMCISGKCERVGCDLKLGSNKYVDECGICGGDGSSCANPLYHWTLIFSSLCSATCGGGYKMSHPVCKNRISGDQVEEDLCNFSQRPVSTPIVCNVHNCPPRWFINDWGECSTTCGGGTRHRQVDCVEETNNTKIIVDESKCGGHKPWLQEVCNEMDCPVWFTTNWSGCSVSCGQGVQTRIVECRNTKNEQNDLCNARNKPDTTQVCSTGISCTFRVDTSEELIPGLFQAQSVDHQYPPPPVPQKLIAESPKRDDEERKFSVDVWSPCSVSCGIGIRRREVICKVELQNSHTIAKLPDKHCSGTKPHDNEPCIMEQCNEERNGANVKDDPHIKMGSGNPAKSYSWREQGFTPCTASCLGGLQELIVTCVRDDTQKATSPYMCRIEDKPEIVVRACNEHSCPPRWSYSEFSPCSTSCGLGIQTRDVNCIHELTQGGSNTVTVPHNRCPQPAPPDRQYCNVLDCPVRWKVSEWSKCSHSCGGGEKNRTVHCIQVLAQNHTVDRAGMCSNPKPSDKKPCNTKSCAIETDRPEIVITNSTYIQHNLKKNKVTVKVGGAAKIFIGTTVKIKCPVKRFDRTKIQWKKDDVLLPQNKKFKSSKKGALRIQNMSLRDMGIYTCIAGQSSASITISVRSKPGEFLTSEEIQKHNFRPHQTDLISRKYAPSAEGKQQIFADDQSHEQNPEKANRSRNIKLFTPTSPSSSLVLDGNLRPDSTKDVGYFTKKSEISNLPSSSSSELLNTPNVGDSSRSSATRIMPNFLSLITKVQDYWPFNLNQPKVRRLSSHRDHRMVTYPMNPQQQILPTDLVIPVTTTLENRNEVVLLGKGNKANLKFEWKVGKWSECSETCGENGLQTRLATCFVILNKKLEEVNGHLCEEAGLKMPNTRKECDFNECPEWSFSEWNSCEKSKCFSFHRAIQKRIIKCQINGNNNNNVTIIDSEKCNFHEKPDANRECENTKCVGKWKVGSWSQCNAKCDKHGEKYRTFHCVWYGTKKPAGDACKNIPRPLARKSCKGTPCNNSPRQICKDLSVFCSNVKSLKMCAIKRYKEQCCYTCRDEKN